MKLHSKSTLTLFFLLFSFLCSAQNLTNPAPHVIPALREWTGKEGYFQFNTHVNLVIDPNSASQMMDYVTTFSDDLKALNPSFRVKIKVGKANKGDIYFQLDGGMNLPHKEGYVLSVDEIVVIKAKEAIGAFWATRSILQILEQDKYHKQLPKGSAIDYPQFSVRGLVLDVARKFFTIDFLRDYVKFMSYYKMNDFQIHLNDNGFKQFFNNDWSKTYSAFRLENSTYPSLTAKDGSYTKKEFIALQQMAQRYGVNIIPEIDVPAHSLAFVKAVPEIASKNYGDDHLDINNPLTYQVIDNVFKEYLEGENPVFIGKEVHIGTDEYAKKEAESFRAFTDHYIKYVEGFGKKVRMWGALTHAKGTTPVKSNQVTMNLWYNGYADPKEMINLGYDAISTPDGWLYIVPKAGYYYDYLNVEKLYKEWTPNLIGNQVFDENHPQIKGGSFAVWNDHVGNGITEKDVHDRVFPAMQVLAQKMWLGSSAQQKVPFSLFSVMGKSIGEAPGLNIRGRIKSLDSIVLFYDFNKGKAIDLSSNQLKAGSAYQILFDHSAGVKSAYFKGASSYIKTSLQGIGYDYTVHFSIKPDLLNGDDAEIFSSTDAIVKLNQQTTGKLGFSREGYHYHFNYTVPPNKWTNITITGNNKGTSLYVNGLLVEKLEGAMQEFANTKDKMAKVQTLFFPLAFIGSQTNSFKGYLDDIKVFNQILSDEQIKSLGAIDK